ncbi:MAG: glycosyltransferase [Thermodesulfobacteriota bacterium]|nr:glycosyltransferase [Thermodesulfobacteriota bacterium]
MKRRVIFIADGSIKNPILHSQGLPLYGALAARGYGCSFVTFETRLNENAYKRLVSELVKKHGNIGFKRIAIRQKWPVPSGAENVLKALFWIVAKCYRGKLHIIHARSLVPGIVALWAKVCSFNRLKVIYDKRGVLIEEEILKGNWDEGSMKVRLLYLIEWLLLKYSDQIVTVSYAFKEHLLTTYELVGLKSKIHVVPNGTKLSEGEKSTSEMKHLVSKVTCVYSGSAAPWQKIDDVLIIFSIAESIFRNISFKIFTYQKEIVLDKMSAHPKVWPKLEMSDLPPHEVRQELAKCSFGLLIRERNLINRVASPLKFAEYLAAGIPVLISEGIGDTEQVVRKYNIGVIIKNGNYAKALVEMKKLLTDPSVYSRCRTAASSELNVQDGINGYVSIYQKLR